MTASRGAAPNQHSSAAGPGLGCVQLYRTDVKARVELSFPLLRTNLGIPKYFPVIILSSMPLTYTMTIETEV